MDSACTVVAVDPPCAGGWRAGEDITTGAPVCGLLSTCCADHCIAVAVGALADTPVAAGPVDPPSGIAAAETPGEPATGVASRPCATTGPVKPPSSGTAVQSAGRADADADGALLCVACTIPLRGSSVAVDPNDVVAVLLVALVHDGIDGNELEPIEGIVLDALRVEVEGRPDVIPLTVDAIEPIDGFAPVDGVVPVDGVESAAGESESVVSAQATPAQLATAAPTPKATANAPTRPMYLA